MLGQPEPADLAYLQEIRSALGAAAGESALTAARRVATELRGVDPKVARLKRLVRRLRARLALLEAIRGNADKETTK